MDDEFNTRKQSNLGTELYVETALALGKKFGALMKKGRIK